MFLSEFGVERTFALVKRTIPGEIGRKWIATIGPPTNALDDKATTEHQRSSDPLIGHQIAEFLRVFGADHGDPARVSSG